ncbi:MAG: hypothetical protein ACLPSW_32220 [Roseiarcus sp.]
MSTARSKRAHASGTSSTFCPFLGLAMDEVQRTLETYAQLMMDIRTRHQLLREVLVDQRGLPLWAAVEFMQLQIRLICETFALACLVAHGDILATRSGKLASTYQADVIMNTMEKLHPHFYPRPINQIIQNGKPVSMTDVKDGFLTKPEMLKSYYETARFVHIGDLKTVLKGKPKPVDLNSMAMWAQKLFVLLNTHQIYLADSPNEPPGPPGLDGVPVPKRQLGVVMQAQDGKPQVALLVRVIPE